MIGFLIIFPFSLVGELANVGQVWLTVSVSVIISWMFVCLGKVGQYTTNPFEGGVNDVPITSMSQAMEIELQQMLDIRDIPQVIKPMNIILI